MKIHHLDKMTRGWFVGAFEPTVLHTADVEVGIKRYPAGASEAMHFHKIATEVTVILDGVVMMNGRRLEAGDIIVLEPGEPADFQTLTPVTTVVVKHPGTSDDKFLISAAELGS